MKKLMGVLALFSVLFLTACGGAATNQGADDFPNRNIEFIVPFGAGGASDIAARSIADVMDGLIDPNITVTNVPGGGTATGTMQAFNQPADGYTVLFLTPSALIVQSQGLAPINFTDEFVPVGTMQIDQLALSISPNNPNFHDVESLIAYAKANPGAVTIGGQSPRGLHEFIAQGFAQAAGIELTFVPYDSAGEQLSAMLGGELDIYLENISALANIVQANPDVKPIVVINDGRITAVPQVADVPSTTELGIDFTQGSWRALAVRKDTPPAVIQKLENLLHQVYESDAYQERATLENSNYISGWRTAAQSQTMWNDELAAFKHIFAE